MSENKNLLMISYFFPPMAGAGVFRSLKFAKYLPLYDWRPHVITVKSDSSYELDEGLLSELPQDVIIERVNYSWKPSRLLMLAAVPGVQNVMSRLIGHQVDAHEVLDRRLISNLYNWQIPDTRYGWIKPAIKHGIDYLKKQPVDVIYTTSAPFSSHLIGYKLKRKMGLPWVADFRDEWTKNLYIHYPTFLHRWINEYQEKITIRNADLVLSVSQSITDLLSKGDRNTKKYKTIPNGYDPIDFDLAKLKKIPLIDSRKFVLGYGGAFYSLRSPQILINAIEGLFENGMLSPEQFRLRFWGYTAGYSFSNPVWNLSLENLGYLSHFQSIQNLVAADALILLMPSTGGNRTYPGKLFEYLAAKKPILALIPEGVAADLIREANAGIVVCPDDVRGIQLAILDLYEQWKNDQHFMPNDNVIQRFNRQIQAAQLAQWLNELI